MIQGGFYDGDTICRIEKLAIDALAIDVFINPKVILQEIRSKPIKPKEEKMQEPMITINKGVANFPDGWKPPLVSFTVPLSEAERLGEEAKRIKAEIAKREEIQVGDYCVWSMVTIFKVAAIESPLVKDFRGDRFSIALCRKLHPTPEVKAWLDGVVGGEG